MSTSPADAPGRSISDSGRTWVVPGYTELAPLGGGGFGEVVLATHDASGNPVAIKYLHPDLLRDPEQLAGFRAEAHTLAGLDSPHVVRLYEYVAGPSGAAIVMELVEGVTLATILERQGKTTPEAALVVLYGSLLGLAAAHAKGVVHRDYKPANVLIDSGGISKLTDFGIAALAGGRPMAAGTLRYMPPEQFEGAPATPAADVYAATVTFYQCLAGRAPFGGQTPDELYNQHKFAEIPLEPIPEALRPVIARGMAKDPQARPSDAGRLAAELRDAASDSYGADWEDSGRSHLAEAALLLLALLWPSGAATSTGSTTVVHAPQTEPPTQPGHSAGTGHPASAQGQPGQAQPQPGHPQPSPEARHAAHVRHLEHLKHLEAEHAKAAEAEHAAHAQHVEHVQHAEHVEHVEHLEHVAHVSRGDAKQPTRRRPRLRPRARVLTIGAAAVTAAVVVGAVAAFAASSHHSTPPPSGAPSPSTGAAAPGTTPTAPAGSSQTKGAALADHQTWCGSAFIADDLLNVYIIRGTEPCSSSVQQVFSDYGNKLLENPGSSGDFTVDGWSCSHADVPESAASGVWASCTQGQQLMETIGGPTH
jgi:serine/threonine protein kinase